MDRSRKRPEASAPGQVAGVVLAAGGSSRFGKPKQLASIEAPQPGDAQGVTAGAATSRDETLVHRACRIAIEAGLSPVIVVLGHSAPEVRAAIGSLEVVAVENVDWQTGQGSSVRRGLDAVPADCEGVLILPCDQAFLDVATLQRLLTRFRRLEDRGSWIVAPTFEGRRGAPVLFGQGFLEQLSEVAGDEGGRQLVRAHPDRVIEVELEAELPLLDADTPEALESLVELASRAPGVDRNASRARRSSG